MQKLIITSLIALFSLAAMAQTERKVAIFDPAGSVGNSIREIAREEISSIIVNTGGYTVLERQLINRVLEEHRFQQGGLVDDTQASELGRMIGANFVVVTSISQLGANLYISCKMIDVETARIERQRTAQTQRGTNDFIEVVQRTVREMFPAAAPPMPSVAPPVTQPPRQTQPPPQQQATKPVKSPVTIHPDMLSFEKRKVYQYGNQLSKKEVRNVMANTDALKFYNKGIKRKNISNVLLIGGLVITGGATFLGVADISLYADPNEDIDVFYYDILIAFSTGIAMTSIGLIIKLAHIGSIRRSVYLYNSSFKTNMELDFGITGNGARVTLRF